MIRLWERTLAADVAKTQLADLFASEPIVEHFLTLAHNGDCDLMTALVKIIEGQAMAKAEAQKDILREYDRANANEVRVVVLRRRLEAKDAEIKDACEENNRLRRRLEEMHAANAKLEQVLSEDCMEAPALVPFPQ